MTHNLLPSKQLASLKLLASLAALTLLSCNQGTKTASSFDPVATKTAIEQRNQAFADNLKKGDSVALANFYTDDAQMIGGGPAVSGRKNMISEFNGLIHAGITDAKFTTLGVWGTDSLVTEEGRAVFSDKSMKVLSKGAYMVIWKKAGGDWKLFRDMYSQDEPPKSK
jgi:ketosteroid isomerase-like protein